MIDQLCPVCANLLQRGLTDWHVRCARCAYEGAHLDRRINDAGAHHSIDEVQREQGLKSLRQVNFKQLLQELRALAPLGGALLEVGCAHGWFLSLAKTSYAVTGIEPDDEVRRVAVAAGVHARAGFFPQALRADERFDVIVFNDVFEHLPHPESLLGTVRQHLSPGGVVLLNLPSSGGIFYRMARFLAGLGWTTLFDRMWQKGMPSPHLHYFHQRNLQTLLSRCGWRTVSRGVLPSLRWRGLWSRIAYDKRSPLPVLVLIWLVVVLLLPLIRLLPADIMFVMAVVQPDGETPKADLPEWDLMSNARANQ